MSRYIITFAIKSANRVCFIISFKLQSIVSCMRYMPVPKCAALAQLTVSVHYNHYCVLILVVLHSSF